MNIIQDVIDLEIYDKDGVLITEINKMTKGSLKQRDKDLIVSNATLNLKMLEILGDLEKNEVSDFDKASGGIEDEKTFTFNNEKMFTEVKLIGKGVLYDTNTMKISHDFKIIIPKAVLFRDFSLDLEVATAYSPQYHFRMQSYNEAKDLFQVKLKERK